VEVKDHHRAARVILEALFDSGPTALRGAVSAVGHRVVHGGGEKREAVRIDDNVISLIEEFTPLAPLHNPCDLAGIRAAMELLPEIPHIACFDTTFHQTIPQAAYRYAVPLKLCQKHDIRKYGFHGISHRAVAERAAEMLGRPRENLNAITCHLGNGCSVAAIRQGASVETSMGMTPLEGLVMGTRSGDTDPGVLFYLLQKGVTSDKLNTVWNKRSGLLGLSGISSDMRDVTRAAMHGDGSAELAVEVFCHRLKKYIGAYLALVGKLDALVFTGGIGENAPEIRSRTCADLDHLGIMTDEKKNEAAIDKEADIGVDGERIRVLVIPASEELAIASAVYRLLRA
jgi:acetate kinase